jgi:hypothetical protein
MKMNERKMTKAEVLAIVDDIWGPGPPKPKVVVADDQVVRDAEPHVSKADPNYSKSQGGVVRVRRSDFVTINIGAWEEQMRQKKEERRLRRALDPCRLGLYGPVVTMSERPPAKGAF